MAEQAKNPPQTLSFDDAVGSNSQSGETPPIPEPGMLQHAQSAFDKEFAPSPGKGLVGNAVDSTISTLASPLVHPVKTAQALLAPFNYDTNPGADFGKTGKSNFGSGTDQSGQMVNELKRQYQESPSEAIGSGIGNIAGAYLGGKVAPEVAKAPGKIGEMIPSKQRAGGVFESLNKDLANQPVTLEKTAQPLQRVTEIGERGSTLPTAVNKLLERSQGIEPMTFPEARDYQGSLSDLSGSDKLAMNGRVRGGVAQLNKAFFDDIQKAAEAAGRGKEYADAMKEYRRASQLGTAAQGLKKYAIPAAAGAVGLGAVEKLRKAFE
jgi:hypothetical protein